MQTFERQKVRLHDPPIFPESTAVEWEMEVVFGTPSKNCQGLGVCMITDIMARPLVVPCPHAPARISWQRNRELWFRFRKQDLPAYDLLVYFAPPGFVVEEAFRLPSSVVRRLGMPIRWIHAGIYPTHETAADYLVCFPVAR